MKHNIKKFFNLSITRKNEKLFYLQNGYLIVRKLFSEREMDLLKLYINKYDVLADTKKSLDNSVLNNEYGGGFSSLKVWNNCNGNDIFSKVAKSYKILERSAYFYEDDVYCFHNKLTAKFPGVKGFSPHQDYGGYWKNMGIDKPDPHALFIAIDKSDKKNGCLEIVPKSHLLGNIPHKEMSPDSGIKNKDWDKILSKGYKTKLIELNKGDGVFFHGNTIHLSGENLSSDSRISFIVTLNTKRSSPNKKYNYFAHPEYSFHERTYKKISEKDLSREMNFK